MRENYCIPFGRKQIAIASVLALFVMGGLAEPSFGGVVEGDCLIARAESSSEPQLSESAVETLNKYIVPEQSGKKLALLINDRLASYGMSFASIPEDVRQQYLDATESVCTYMLVDVAVQVTKMESQGASPGEIEEFIKNSIPDVLTKWADSCVRQMVADGIVEKYKGVAEGVSKAGSSESECGKQSSLSPEFLEKYSNAYVSSSVMSESEALCNTDKMSSMLVTNINGKLNALHVTFADVPEKLRAQLLNQSQAIFEEAYVLLVIDGSRMEADGASKEKIRQFINAGFIKAIDAWADKWIQLLVETDFLKGRKAG